MATQNDGGRTTFHHGADALISYCNNRSHPEKAELAAGAATQVFPAEGLSLAENERSLLTRAVEKTNGNQTQAARLLRITCDTLRYRMKKFNLR